MARVLVLFAHPALEKSRVHRRLLGRIPDDRGVTVHDLYESYPDLAIDVGREQDLLAAHDVVVLQFPFYWYGTPPILKQWFDLVLEHDWAYGSKGLALQGKTMTCALSIGAGESAYGPDGFNRYTVPQFLAPVERTAILCHMRWLPAWVVYGTHSLEVEDIDPVAEEYRRVLEWLVDDGHVEADPDPADVLNPWLHAHGVLDATGSGGGR